MSSLATPVTVTFPFLNKTDPLGFVNVDTDGVLRSWAPNGTVLEAAPLNPNQISDFIAFREGIVPAEQTAEEKIIFADVNGLDVASSDLLEQSDEVRPEALLATAAAQVTEGDTIISGRDFNVLDDRQSCNLAYYSGMNVDCLIYYCSLCFGSVCIP